MASSVPPDQEAKWADVPLATPTFGSGGRATIMAACTSIAASPATCLEVLLDASSYASWNRWIPRTTVQKPAPAAADQTVSAALGPFLKQRGEDGEEKRTQTLLQGTEFQFEVHMDPTSETKPRIQRTDLVVTVLEEFAGRDGRKGLRVCWKTRGDPWYLRAERTQELVERAPADGGGCDYTCYETFYGPLAPVVKLFAGADLVRGFGMWMEDLRKASEEKEKERQKSGTSDA